MSAAAPGVVVVKKSRDGEETTINILRRKEFVFAAEDMPRIIPAGGLSVERQRYLYKVVRPFVRPSYQTQRAQPL